MSHDRRSYMLIFTNKFLLKAGLTKTNDAYLKTSDKSLKKMNFKYDDIIYIYNF